MKKILMSVILSLMLTCGIATGCKAEQGQGKETYDRDAGLDPTASTAFFDDFTDREYSASLWSTGNSKWGPDFNHGVSPDNVLWNDSGIVTIKSLGKYYPDQEINYQGGTLVTKDTYGPGRYETRMKMMPRFGACTAFWTFMYGTAQDLDGNLKNNLNQEIDIELNVGGDFRNVWFTNWTTEDDKAHVEKETEFFNADGEWHLYTFEWHTNPMRIDYYIDDIHLATLESNVPYVAGVINIGNWFPQSWAGNADFEEDYMQIDYVRYTPYKGQPCTPYGGGGGGAEFPSVSTPLPQVANMIVNAGFENSYPAAGKTDYVWSFYQDASIKSGAGRTGKGMTANKDGIGFQRIPDILGGFEYRATAWVKLADADSVCKLQAYFLKNSEDYVGTPAAVEISSATTGYRDGEFFEVEFTFTAPEDARRVEITFETTNGSVSVDDVFMNLAKKYVKA